MMNPFADVNWNPDTRARKKFAVSLIIGFPIIAALMEAVSYFKTHNIGHFPIWLGGIGLAVGVILWLLPQIAKPFYVVWYFLGCCVGIVIGNVLFALFFFLVFTPLGLLLRLRKNKPIEKSFDKSRKSYWRDAEKTVDLKRYYRQF
jgi:energy-converting hydrogenase Eha subunit A